MQELGKLDFRINIILIGLEKYMSFSTNNKLIFIDSFQFSISSLHPLVKNWVKMIFNSFNEELDSKVSDFVKQKGFYPYEHMSHFEKFKEQI